MKKNLIRIITTFILAISTLLIQSFTIAAGNGELEVDWFEIMPKLETGDIEDINKTIQQIASWWHVWEEYNKAAPNMTTTKQLNSWIMTRDTLLNYLVFIVKFLSQLWLLVWAGFIIVAWYKYMLAVFQWWKTSAWTSTLSNAIIWVIIVIFSYAIMKILTSIIWLT